MPDTANKGQTTSIAGIPVRPDILSFACGVAAVSIIAVFFAMLNESVHGLFENYPWFEFVLFWILPLLAILGMALGTCVLMSGRGRRKVALFAILLNGPAMVISGALLLLRYWY
jgi:hypothetical protein